jgi:hypothetical protein
MTVTAAASGYRTGQAEDANVPYRTLSDESRRQAAVELTSDDLGPVSIRPPFQIVVVPVDLVLLPDAPPSAK